MKKLFLLFLLVPTLAFAGPDRVEIGSFTAHNGARFSAVYLMEGAQCTEVHLISPEGKEIRIDVERGTKTPALDRLLQQIINQNQ